MRYFKIRLLFAFLSTDYADFTVLSKFIRAIHVSSNKKFDCNLLNNRFLKKKSVAMGNGIETSELL
ncbi:hypothetical protein B5F24_13230 [Bacteroides clarus]|uniref:Uncharacterized protein n=1 Tax=Bacteroides clarus TaxID=626929 RepID=A0A1Y4JK32_9BACE|nr:hypothetical protein B5F24_13230 [Bacteroides clarus]